MIERYVERFAPILVAIVALLTGGAWLAAHGGLGTSPGPHRPYAQPPYPQQPQHPPPQQPQGEPPPQSSCGDCGSCDCSDCAECASGCDVSDCDVSGCGDCSGVDCTLARASTRGASWLVLLLPLALLDAWRRRAAA